MNAIELIVTQRELLDVGRGFPYPLSISRVVVYVYLVMENVGEGNCSILVIVIH